MIHPLELYMYFVDFLDSYYVQSLGMVSPVFVLLQMGDMYCAIQLKIRRQLIYIVKTP